MEATIFKSQSTLKKSKRMYRIIKVLPMTAVLEIIVGIPKMSIKTYRKTILRTEMKILVQR